MILQESDQIFVDRIALSDLREADAILGPWGQPSHTTTAPAASAIVHLGSLKAKKRPTSNFYCMLRLWRKCFGYSMETRYERGKKCAY